MKPSENGVRLRRSRTSVGLLSSAFLVAGMCAVGAASTSASAAVHKASSKTWVIGAPSEYTGSIGAIGVSWLEGLRAYVTAQNKKGGVDGRKLAISSLDSGGDAGVARSNVLQVVQSDHPIAVAGFISSTIDAENYPLAQQFKIPFIVQAAPSTFLDPAQGNQYIFVEDADPVSDISAQVNYVGTLAKKEGLKGSAVKVGIVGYQSPSSVSSTTLAQQEISNHGWTYTGTSLHPVDGTGVGPAAAKAVGGNPNFIIAQEGPTTGLFQMFTALRQNGFKGPILNYPGGTSLSIFKQVNDPKVYGVTTYSLPQQTNLPGIKAFDAAEKAIKGDPNGVFDRNGYAAGLIIGAGLKACGPSCTGPKLKAVLEKLQINSQGFWPGTVGYSTSSHELVHFGEIVNYTNGKVNQLAKEPIS